MNNNVEDARTVINYTDLQVPSSSNHGSMKKSNNKINHINYQQQSNQHKLINSNLPVIQPLHRKPNITEVQAYKPRFDEQAEL